MDAETIRFPAGLHIREAAKLLVERAPASGMFNEIELRAEGGETPEAVVARFTNQCEERAARYRVSPEGIAAAQARSNAKLGAQQVYDKQMAKLPALDFTNDLAVLDWLCAIQDATDTSGVRMDKNAILIAFATNGFRPNANCGDAFDGADRDNFHRWIVGQALDTLSAVSIHPMIHKFAADWREKFNP